MPLKTDFGQAPYNDDTLDPRNRNYYKMLFQPAVSVQVRELNGMQTFTQQQIERLGNNIFKRGTIIDGCNFTFYNDYPYVKINDLQDDGLTVIPNNFVGFLARNANNLIASIINSEDGFESTDPDLKTLYVKYINSGDSGSEATFSAGQQLTIYDSNNSIFRVNIDSTGSGYSNTDNIVIVPKLVINVSSGSFNSGDTITDTTTGAQAVIVSTEDVTTRTPYANVGGVVAVTSGNTTVIGTGTQFENSFAAGEYVALYSNSTTYSLFQIGSVTNSTYMVLETAPSFSNSSVTYANCVSSSVILTVRPTNAALSNKLITDSAWTFSSNSSVQGATVLDVALVESVLGAGAAAELITDSAGRIQVTTVTQRGAGYTSAPYVGVQTSSGALSSLSAQNYYSKITVSSVTDSVGSGYAFGVGDGLIYQKGYFIAVDPQVVIVDKYSQSPNNVVVVFDTQESIIDANIDTSLTDNVTGTNNKFAPGANRLKLYPVLSVTTPDSVQNDPELFTLAAWNGGVPYKQNQRTQYNVILDEMASRTRDTSGDFVVDRFLTTTTSPNNTSLESNTFNVVVDPGTAYIDGFKVQTLGNYTLTIPKATGTRTLTNTKVSLNYDNYIKINELGGVFDFDSAPVIDLYDTAKGFISNTALITSANTAPVGTKIGEARIRNLVHRDGAPGTANAIFQAYLFDVVMNAGKNFKNVRSISTTGAIADVVLEDYDIAASNSSVDVYNPVLYSKNNSLLFTTGFNSILNSNNIFYQYRTVDNTLTVTNNGIITVSLASLPNVNFPYTATLSSSQREDLYVVPSANLVAYSTITTGASVNTTASVIQTSDQVFIDALNPGDYVYVTAGASNTAIKRVVSVTNNIHLTVDSPFAFTNSAAVTVRKMWPANVPINLGDDAYTANVDVNSDILTIDLGDSLNTAASTNVTVSYVVERSSAAPATKTPNRNIFVKLRLSDNEGSVDGPWCLGVPDIFRMRNVYLGNSSVSESSTNVTDDFYIDHNQTMNYYDYGYLFKEKRSGLVLSEDDYLLVEFDCFTAPAGFYNVTSYVSGALSTRLTNDSKTLAQLTADGVVNTLEIPELWSYDGKYYDLINCVDFRPYASATASLSTTVGGATVNPSSTVSFSSATKYFPVPDSNLRQDTEYFLPRSDNIVLGKDGVIDVMEGSYELGTAPPKPSGSMILNNINVPVYPAIPKMPSSALMAIIDTRVANEKYLATRYSNRTISTTFTKSSFNAEQPSAYTNYDIGQLERRIGDLEYYVSLNLVETNVKDIAIPSSVSPSINRFKYGYYADDYTSDTFTDIDSPEYSASFENGTLVVPLKEIVDVVHANTVLNTVDYIDYKIISQENATFKSSDCTCPPSANIIYTSMQASEDNRKKYPNDNPRKETRTISMASSGSANATIWMNMYGGGDKIEIWQANTLILTGDDAVKLTSAEASALKKERPFNKSGEAGRFDWSDAGPVGAGKAKNVCKITWTHNPSLGTDYTIIVYKMSRMWRYRIDYPVDGDVGNVGCAECPPSPPNEIVFDGVMRVSPKKLPPFNAFLTKKQVKKTPVGVGTQFDIEVSGMKPNTIHYFYFMDKNESDMCNPKKPYTGGWGTELKTDASGKLTFKYLFQTSRFGSNAVVSDGNKLMKLVSSDGKSSASFSVGVKAPLSPKKK